MESENSKKRSIIIGVIVAAVVIALLSLVIFTTVVPNATKGNGENGNSSNEPDIVGSWKAYATVDAEGTEHPEEIENLKKDYGIEMYASFEKDGTGSLTRKTADGIITLPYTYKNGVMYVKESQDAEQSYEGSYALSEDKTRVKIIDDAGTIIVFTRIE